MGAIQQMLLGGSGDGPSGVMEKVYVSKRYAAATQTISSTSYVDLTYDGTNTVSVTFTKSAGSALLVSGFSTFSYNGNFIQSFLGVSDGTTDYDLGGHIVNSYQPMHHPFAERLISGLGAGTYTFKLRIKTNGSSVVFKPQSAGSPFGNYAYLRVMEATQTAKYSNVRTLGGTTGFSWITSSYVDLQTQQTGGTGITASVTKTRAGSRILVRAGGKFGKGGNTGNATTGLLGVRVNSGTDYDLAPFYVYNDGGTKYPLGAGGARIFSGLPAGVNTFRMRVKGPNGSDDLAYNLAIGTAFITAIEID